jgi:hypothetical protein
MLLNVSLWILQKEEKEWGKERGQKKKRREKRYIKDERNKSFVSFKKRLAVSYQ